FACAIQKNIFDSTTDAIAALEEFFLGRERQDLGTHPESFLETIDALRDGEVSQRIEYLFSRCLGGIRANLPLAVVLRNTLNELCQNWPVRVITGEIESIPREHAFKNVC